MNSSRAVGAHPQNRHFVHTGSITRRQPPQTFCCFGVLVALATPTMTSSKRTAIPMIRTTSAPVDTGPQTMDLNLKFVLPSVITSLSTRSCLRTFLSLT